MLSKMNLSEEVAWYNEPAATMNNSVMQQAREHQLSLTKPTAALGDLEQIAIQMAGLRGDIKPRIEHARIIVFVADHGIAQEGVSAYPQTVTAQMLKNFVDGGAAISVLAKQLGIELVLVDVGINGELFEGTNVIHRRIRNGTHNFARQAAMTRDECQQALLVGKEIIDAAKNTGMDFLIAGEMGIGNTSAATALASCITKLSAVALTGAGTGLSKEGVAHKARIIQQAVTRSKLTGSEPLATLAYFGGFEIVAMVGAYLRCAQLGIPMLIDGYISSVAALYACKLNAHTRDWMFFGHRSSEPGHQHILNAMQAKPILSLNMRLGEGSGAAVAMTIINSALALHNNMATFNTAGVAEKVR
jgi:nicotinate-nucleotide--dimethylbenzimidazole phosphoribosyltransferase